MTTIIAAESTDAAIAFIEIGGGRARALRARLGWRDGSASRPYRSTCSPGSPSARVASPLDVSANFIHLAGEIGVLLLLLTLGLEYSADELRQGMRTGVVPGLVDAAANFTPGMVVGLALGGGRRRRCSSVV